MRIKRGIASGSLTSKQEEAILNWTPCTLPSNQQILNLFLFSCEGAALEVLSTKSGRTEGHPDKILALECHLMVRTDTVWI